MIDYSEILPGDRSNFETRNLKRTADTEVVCISFQTPISRLIIAKEMIVCLSQLVRE